MNELFRPDGMRIQNFTVETPTKPTETTFDPERAVTAIYSWQEMKERIEADRARLYVYLVHRANMLQLFPERRAEFPNNQELVTSTNELLIEQIKTYKQGLAPSSFLRLISAVRTVCQDAIDYEAIYTQVRSEIRNYFTGLDSTYHARAYQAFPRQVKPFLEADDLILQHQRQYQAALRDYTHEPDGYLIRYINNTADCRILFPERLAEFAVKPDFWPRAEAHLTTLRDDWDSFLGTAIQLKAIAAEEIIVGENGLKLILPKRHNGPVAETSIPEQRRY